MIVSAVVPILIGGNAILMHDDVAAIMIMVDVDGDWIAIVGRAMSVPSGRRRRQP